MKSLLVSAAFASIVAAAAQADLVIEGKIESPQMNSTMTTKIRGDKLRTDVAGGPVGSMSVIMDNQSGDSVNLMHGAKMAMRTSAADMKRMLEMAKQFSGAGSGEPAKPQKSDKSEKVGEYDCDIYTWTNGNMSGRFWVAKKHPQEAMLKEAETKMKSGVLGSAQSGADTSSLPGPVLKSETVAAGQTTLMTILSVKEQKVEENTFDVPADYQSMPSFGGQVPGGAPSPTAPIPRPIPRSAPPAPGAK